MSDDKNIILSIPSDKFKFLKKTIDDQKDFVYKLKMHPLIKTETLRGLRIIDSILSTSKKE